MHFWQEYPRNGVVSFLGHQVKGFRTSVCLITGDINLGAPGRVVCKSRFSREREITFYNLYCCVLYNKFFVFNSI